MTATARLSDRRPLPVAAKLGLAVEVVAAYVVARWAMRRGLREALETVRSVRGASGSDASDRDAVEAGRRLGRAATRTLTALPADSRCLMSSLVLTRMLARRGIDSKLVIAVEPGEKFGAHAWVEHDGAALLNPGDAAFERLVTL